MALGRGIGAGTSRSAAAGDGSAAASTTPSIGATSRPASTASMRGTSSSFSHREITTVATPLPIRLVMARASDMNRSMPRISATPATGIWPTVASVAASVTKPLPTTPAAPFDVSSSTARMVSSCCRVSEMSQAWAMKTAAMVR